MPLPFNKNLDLKLLDLVKENPILYNTKHSKYLDFDSREVVWQKIGDALSRPASEFAGIQCQIQLGDFQEEKHKPGFVENLNEYLPETYSSSWGIEKKMLRAFRKHQGLSPLDAKNLYIKTARDLPTYGVTFFLVKEKQKDKKKLVPRLLGINAEAILRLDENTKEILQQWPLTHVKTYHVGKSETFTLNFGDYSDKEYSCKTQDAYRIRDILEGYIDIIRRRMLARPCTDPGDSMAICQDNIQSGQSHIIQHVTHQPNKLVKETFVGPSKIMSHSQGAIAQQGTQIMTMQQLIQTNQMKNTQNATKGEVAVRADMSSDCVRKLKRMNSNSVKIVTLLTDPSEANVKDTQKLVANMQDDLVVVEMGVKDTAKQQTVEESRKMLLDEMQDLTNYMNKLSGSTKPGHVDPTEAKDAAEKIADLTTEMFFSQDPKTKRRSELLNRSKTSIIAGEKLDDSIRRASFMAAATSATTGIDQAKRYLDSEFLYSLDDGEVRQLRADAQDRLGKLNAALALYLTAHSDPNNIDYAAAMKSMNDIAKLSPQLALDAQKLASTEDEETRAEMLKDMRTLFDGVKQLCSLTGTDDHEKMQEASNNYADVANKLLFTFSRGKNVDKENEIIDLAKDAGAKTSQLLITANELTHLVPTDPAVGEVDKAGVRSAGAARDLLACAQLTAPAIHEPHCQSALTAAAEGLSSSVHRLSSTWKPLVEDPSRQKLGEQLHQREMEVHKALDRLKDAYANLSAADMGGDLIPMQERQRLKFVYSLACAKNNLQDLQYNWDKPAEGGAKQAGQNLVQELKLKEAQRRLSPQMAQLNAAIAALAVATSDRDNPDYATAELALNTISELMPQIVKDMETVSSKQDEATRNAMQQHIIKLCEAAKEIFANVDHLDGLGESAKKFSAASGKLVFLISPGSDKGKEKMVCELSEAAYDSAAQVLSQAHALQEQAGDDVHALGDCSARAERHARALLTVAKVTAPSIDEARCASALTSAVEQLRMSTDELNATCQPHLKSGTPEYQKMQDSRKQLQDSLNKLLAICNVEPSGGDAAVAVAPSGQQKKQRLQFINSISGAKKRLDAAEQQMKESMKTGASDKKQNAGPNVVQELKRKEAERCLPEQMSQLHAAIAALALATADKENPDYAVAESAIKTISEVMPQIITGMDAVSSSQDEATRKEMQKEMMELCEAAKEMVGKFEDPNGQTPSLSRLNGAYKKLMHLIDPKADESKLKEVRAHFVGIEDSESELFSTANQVNSQLTGAAAAEVESKLEKARQDWNTLNILAAITEPNIADPNCQATFGAAVEQVRRSTKELVAACQPHMKPGSENQVQMEKSQDYLQYCLNRVLNVWNIEPSELDPITIRREKENEEKSRRRLQFQNSMSDAKKRVDVAEETLKQPLACAMMREEDVARARLKLANYLAELNVAVAALATASASSNRGDYEAAQQAVNSITDLMPKVVQDTCVLSGTMVGDEQDAMLQHARELCDAARALCDNAADPDGMKEAAAKLSNTSGRLVFILSPTKDHRKEKQIRDLSASAYHCASDLLNRLEPYTFDIFDSNLPDCIKHTTDAAEALQTTAQVTAKTISSPLCSAALVAAAEKLRVSAKEVPISSFGSEQEKKALQNSKQQLENSLDKLVQACQSAQDGSPAKLSPEQREKQRLQFINSLTGARGGLDDAQHLLKQPVTSSVTGLRDPKALQRQLADKLAQLNGAVAALAAATADREHPDYASAERAVSTIRTLMPQLVQDAKTLSARKDGPTQQAMLQQVQQLCDTSKAICDSAGQPQGLGEAAAKFANASETLMYTVCPTANHGREEQIKELSTVSCVRASELLSHVQALTQQVPGDIIATDLDQRGAATADATQALLTVAQVTASSMGSPYCQSSLESAVETLRGSAAELAIACEPHVKSGPQQQQLQGSRKELEKSLDELLQACRAAQFDAPGVPATLSPTEQEKQRLQFIKSLGGAEKCFDDVQKVLKQPVSSSLSAQQDVGTLQRSLADKLADLNAAVANLAAATADREYPDYASAQRAFNTITTLMPELAQDARMLSATKEGPAKQAVLQQVQQLCDASKAICKTNISGQALNEAAAKFTDASSKLMSTVSPAADPRQEQQIIDLSADSCVRASELLSHVQALTQQVPGDIATELDQRGATTADAAQALLTVAQVTASSMGSSRCQASLESAVETLRGSAAELTASCLPHVKSGAQQQQLQDSRKDLAKSLDVLLQACRVAQSSRLNMVSPVEREQQRVKFIRSVSTASSHLDSAEKQLKEPLVCALVRPSNATAAHDALRRRLAQLNASVAALTQATNDYKQPDYPMAERSIITITELMPYVVQESKALSCTRDDDTQILIQENLNELYDASRNICNNANDARKLNEAAATFAEKSSKLVALMDPGNDEQDISATHTQGVKGKGPGPVAAKPQRAGQKPAVPVRATKVAHPGPSRNSLITQDFLENLRCEESHDNAARVVAAEAKRKSLSKVDEDKKQFALVVDTSEEQIQRAKDSIQQFYDADHIYTPGIDAVEMAHKEQDMEDTLARAGVEVAALVSANYADKLDYKAALEPTVALTKSVRNIVDDGTLISSTLPDNARKPFLCDLMGLCDVTRNICEAARSDKKLTEAAVAFGNQSTKLLRVVSADVNPALEKEVISRAKTIGDCASGLAQEVNNVASTGDKGDADRQRRVQDMCVAGAQCVDAAGKLVYTAKLVAPTIHHATCQEALTSSAETLSSNMTSFSETLKPLASDPQSKKLTEEAWNLEQALQKLLIDLRSGRLGTKRGLDKPVMLDTPLRQLTLQIIDNSKKMAEHGELQPEVKQEYNNYCSRLTEAIRNMDLANARCQRAPHDKHRRDEFEIAVQDLQMMSLQTRPSKAGQQQNNIVDFREFLQGLVTESDHLTKVADKNQAATGKRTTDDIKLLCSKISEDASKLMDPTHHAGTDSFDDIMEIYEYGQECDLLVNELSSTIQSIPDQKVRNALRAKLLPLTENCNLLRFATNSALSMSKSAAFEVALQDLEHFESTIIKSLANKLKERQGQDFTDDSQVSSDSEELTSRAQLSLLKATSRVACGEPQALRRALTSYSMTAVADTTDSYADTVMNNLLIVSENVKLLTKVSSREHAVWQIHEPCDLKANEIMQDIKKTRRPFKDLKDTKQTPGVLKEEDTDKLIMCQRMKVEGTRNQLEDKFNQLSTKLSTMSGSIFQSVKKPESLSRSLHATADSAAQLASIARGLKDYKRPGQCAKIENASHEMCLATYRLLKTSEALSQNPNHPDNRRKLMEACHHLNDTVNRLNRVIHPEMSISRECNEMLRNLQLQRSALLSPPQPAAASPYAHCLEALQSQRDILHKLNSDKAMSREEFLQSMLFVTTAIGNSTECAAQATYLLSLSVKDKDAATEGLIDVAKIHKGVAAIHDTCVRIVMDPKEQVMEEKKILEQQVEELKKDLEEGEKKTKDENVKRMLKKCQKNVDFTSKAFYNVVNIKKPEDVIISLAISLADDVRHVSKVLEHPSLVPTAGELSPATQALCDEVIKNSTALVSSTQDLIKEIKISPEQSNEMKWSSYNKRREVLSAFEALIKSIKCSGQEIEVLEADIDDSEQNKSYVQKQTDAAFKWLHKPMTKSDIRAKGQEAVKNLIEIGNKMSEDLAGADKEDMRHLVEETEQLYTQCCKKYDQEQYSLLMERIRELQKAIQRMTVTRVVEDFMDAEEPLADLDILADAERDEKSRKFLLERKIAELLAQLGRVTRTARFIADTGSGGPNVVNSLKTCSEQTELLAPMLVKAAEERIHKPDDKVAVENYKTLLAKYSESLSKVRDLCDQSVDPMDFVQTAGETMQRMREDSTSENDPMKCAYTSAVITKLANRVIYVGLSSSTARADPELQRALTEAQQQLSAATPAPDTRASRMPDWKDTTAKILRATGEVESALGGENIFKKQPDTDQPIYNEALNLHVAIRDWSSRDNEIVAVAKRMAVLMAKLSGFMNADKQREVLTTSKSIVAESYEVARLAKKLAHECTDHRIKTNLLQVCERIPTISGQLKMLTTVKGSSLGHHGTQEDKEAMDMLVGNAQSLMISIQDVVKAAASASVKIMSQRGPRIKWVRKTYY